MHRLITALSAAMVVSLVAAPAAAQTDYSGFDPFISIQGEVVLKATYRSSEASPFPDASETLTAPIFALPDPGLATLDSGYIEAEDNNSGAVATAQWKRSADFRPATEQEPGPFFAYEAHEFRFTMNGSADSHNRGTIRISVTIELDQWTDIYLRIDNAPPSGFSASFGSIEAASNYQPQAGYLGNVADGTLFRTETLAPGEHHLNIAIVTTDANGNTNPTHFTDTSLTLRFEQGACPADLNGDGVLDYGDIHTFVAMYLAACGI